MEQPYGQKAKWAMVALCKGQTVNAEIVATDDHGRHVAKCTLPDERDLSAELVKQGLALDWRKFSGGVYRDLEPQGVRKKLWLADARQKGRMDVWENFERRRAERAGSKTSE
ncbi:MAG: thermonuclease family protein [Rhodobacteraceae bacterium]|nr:thermonuclease family protein [Paracoccaceae bacterium]